MLGSAGDTRVMGVLRGHRNKDLSLEKGPVTRNKTFCPGKKCETEPSLSRGLDG